MRLIRVTGLSLVCVFAMSAAAATSASAAEIPVFRVCRHAVPRESGRFNDNLCSLASHGRRGEGKWELGEWHEGTHAMPTLSGSIGAPSLSLYIKTTGIVAKVVCTGSHVAGSVIGLNAISETITYKGCKSMGHKCTSIQAGEIPGRITTYPLFGEFIKISTGSGVALRLEGAGPGGAVAEYDCAFTPVQHDIETGDSDGEVTGDVNSFSANATNAFSVNAGGEQVINDEEDGIPGEDTLRTKVVGVGEFDTGLEAIGTVHTNERMELELP